MFSGAGWAGMVWAKVCNAPALTADGSKLKSESAPESGLIKERSFSSRHLGTMQCMQYQCQN